MNSPCTFHALVFDVGGVIVGHDNDAMYRRIAARCAASPSAEEVKALIRRTKWSLGTEPVSTLHDRLQRELVYGGDWPQFVEDWTSHLVVAPSMAAFVAQLATTYRVILFSNTNAVHSHHVSAHMPQLAHVERYLSCDLGLAKPAPEAFRRVAELAGIDPARSLMIDDVQTNVEGARQAGFQGLLFEGERALREALSELHLIEAGQL